MPSTSMQQALQDAEDEKMRKKAEKAYNAASTTAPAPKVVKKAKGGSVTRADGCVTKGHTKGKMV